MIIPANHTLLHRFIYFLLLTTLPASCMAVSDEDALFVRYFARVKKNDINVRARPSTSSEIMYQVKKSEDVLVIGESGSWVKVKPKSGHFAYVHQDMQENGIISKQNVNVRAGPGLENSILGKLAEGEPVQVVEKMDEWLKIEMPRYLGFYIASNLVEFLCPEAQYQEYLQKEKLAKKAFAEAEMVRKDEFTKRYMDVDHEKIMGLYQAIVDAYPNTAEARKSLDRIEDARHKKMIADQKRMTVNELKQAIGLYEEAEEIRKNLTYGEYSPSRLEEARSKYQLLIKEFPGTKEAKLSIERLDDLEKIKAEKTPGFYEKVQFKSEGKLKPYRARYGQETGFTHVLAGGFLGKKIYCAVSSEVVDLRAFENKHVEIEGSIIDNHEDLGPVVKISKIMLKQ